MEWSNEKVLQFLELYQMQPCIWDPNNSGHRMKTSISHAWTEMKNNMEDPTCTVKELKKKKDSLMSMYRGYKTKTKKSEASGAGALDVYTPTWFPYEFMDGFLAGIYKCNPTMNTEENIQKTIEPTDSLLRTQATLTPMTFKKRQLYPPELQQAKRQMDQAFNILQPRSRTLQQIAPSGQKEEEDENTIFGKLIAKKLRNLDEDRRDLMMIKINQLFYDERHLREDYSPLSIVKCQEDNIPQSLEVTADHLPSVIFQEDDIPQSDKVTADHLPRVIYQEDDIPQSHEVTVSEEIDQEQSFIQAGHTLNPEDISFHFSSQFDPASIVKFY